MARTFHCRPSDLVDDLDHPVGRFMLDLAALELLGEEMQQRRNANLADDLLAGLRNTGRKRGR